MEDGQIGILNVGAGDTRLSFNNKNPAETIRAGRIVKDMLRRGYALLVEVEQADGTKAYQRALDFDETKCEYIIADFDPTQTSHEVNINIHGEIDQDHEEIVTAAPSDESEEAAASQPTRSGQFKASRRPRKAIAASKTRAVAVSRSAGG